MNDPGTVAERVAQALGGGWRGRATDPGHGVIEGPDGEEVAVTVDEGRASFVAITWLVPHQRPYSRHALSVRLTAPPEQMAAELETRLLTDYRLRRADARSARPHRREH